MVVDEFRGSTRPISKFDNVSHSSKPQSYCDKLSKLSSYIDHRTFFLYDLLAVLTTVDSFASAVRALICIINLTLGCSFLFLILTVLDSYQDDHRSLLPPRSQFWGSLHLSPGMKFFNHVAMLAAVEDGHCPVRMLIHSQVCILCDLFSEISCRLWTGNWWFE